MKQLMLTIGAVAALSTAVLAQEPPAVSVGTWGGQAQAVAVRSPEVLADGRITFRLFAPRAADVLVQGNWPGGRDLAMTKDASGVWSVTTGVLQAELWAYTFSVNGVRTLDPRNYNVVRDGVGFMNTGFTPHARAIVGDIVPFVDRHDRTLPTRESRAIAGLSMGSGIATNVGLKHLDVFASVGIMSSGTFGRAVNGVVPGANLLEQVAPGFFADPAATNKKLKLLFFSCGTEDNRIESLTRVEADLTARKITFTFGRYPGEHEWKVWRHSLVDMAPLLFR